MKKLRFVLGLVVVLVLSLTFHAFAQSSTPGGGSPQAPSFIEQWGVSWIIATLKKYPWFGTVIFVVGALRLALKPIMSVVEQLCANNPAKAAELAQFETGPIWGFILWLFDYVGSLKLKACAVHCKDHTARVGQVACFFLLIAVMLTTGCVTKNMVDGHYIYSVTSRGMGIEVAATDAATQTPKVLFGAFSSTVTAIPTATNTTIASPNFANNVQSTSSLNPFNQGIGESIASGNYQTSDGTNISTQPIVPKARPTLEQLQNAERAVK